ncbi:hypothetical protein [Nocardioides zhouii]|uniref:Uncharacterized protein n=1 Tax=Nocardioides zhouii TaxID=1168729 RepID=A0A4Q2T0V4_9ACTN|nr:hypothetical protein [Nocardioides zhouii]RYC11501.1 hypothetical protein EUA94_09050 [Nocardioides zhouii]
MGVLVKWLVVLALLVAGAVGINAWASGPDLSCPGSTLSGIPEGGPLSPTADDALGDRLDDAAQVTEESSDAKGFHTVTYRGYDADGELIRSVVVEGPVQWRVARIDTCE